MRAFVPNAWRNVLYEYRVCCNGVKPANNLARFLIDQIMAIRTEEQNAARICNRDEKITRARGFSFSIGADLPSDSSGG